MTDTLKRALPKFYKLFPMLLLCILPAMATFGLISPEWFDLDAMIEDLRQWVSHYHMLLLTML